MKSLIVYCSDYMNNTEKTDCALSFSGICVEEPLGTPTIIIGRNII